jgi:membrane-associated phospholipid phosphatase
MESTKDHSVEAGPWGPLPQDLVVVALSILFAGFSFAFPDSAPSAFEGFARGNVMGGLFVAIAVLALLAPFIRPDAPAVFRFLRTFYPQILLPLFFEESIILSAEIMRGFAFDGLIAGADKALFGFQPSRRFHQSLAGIPAINEMMFGGYFLYYVLFAVTPWLPWLRGRRDIAEREIFVYVSMMAIIFTWYLFFRVEGPKYWFDDLRSAGYSEFSGGMFVNFFQGVFRSTRLDGAAFPSTHVAFSLLMTIYATRISRRLLWFYVPAFLLIASATVYIYAHYFTDILGGIAATLLLEPLLWRLYPRLAGSLGAATRGTKQ